MSRRPFHNHKNDVLVESGTYMGDGIQYALECGFKKVISFEIDTKLYNNAKKRFSNNPNVKIFNKSSIHLFDQIKDIDTDITFWLDGHFSDGVTGYDQECPYPLLKELESISKHHIKTHTILVDDRRLLKKHEIKHSSEIDPSTIGYDEEQIINHIKMINKNYEISYEDGHIKKDIIVASINLIYKKYTDYIKMICDTNNIDNFKNNSDYRQILEHVNKKQGLSYLNLIRNEESIDDDDIIKFCQLNDKIGNPIKESFGNIHTSPSSLRYIYHSILILKYLKKLDMKENDLIELGGGYGGLYLALKYFSNIYNVEINSYTIIDLEQPSRLQKLYHNLHKIDDISYINALTFGQSINKKDCFLISNYAFSEISINNQKEYIKNLFPKVIHGFMCWNMIEIYDFGFVLNIENEIPNTGDKFNKYVYF